MSGGKQGYHAVLGLTSDASDDAIRAAYKKLALQWHPDRHLVEKERAAQMFIEVNQAYHALMDGKESAHSSSTESSSSANAPTGSSADHSDAHTKSTQASSRPPSATSQSSKFSAPSDGQGGSTPNSNAHSKTPPTMSSYDKSSSHPSPRKPSPEFRPTRMKSGPKISKSHGHLRDPPFSAATEAVPPASTYGRSSEGLGDSKSSEKATGPSRSPAGAKHNSHSQRTSQTSTGRPRTTKPVIPPPSARLHKSPKFPFADEFVHKFAKGSTKSRKEPFYPPPRDQDEIPFGSPLRAINTPRGASKEWIFPLPLILDEMYHGTTCRFLITRELLSHRTEQVEISINIPPGMRSGTRIVCPKTGHQRKDGSLQDVVFLVEEIPDERFSRVRDDLFLDVCIPWADPLADQGGEICIQGIDGEEITFTLPYPIYDKSTEGQVLIKGAGMPIRDGRKTVGCGDMIVRWRVVFASHQSKWQTLKRVLHLDA